MKSVWLGEHPYVEALEMQRTHRSVVMRNPEEGVLWMLEHPPVVTTGRRGAEVDAASLAERGIPVVRTERGGLATYHGPGQLVGYLICDLEHHGLKVRQVVSGIEDGVIDWLSAHDVVAHRRCKAPGIWVGDNKICAIGLHIRRGVSMHGFALNLTTDLDGFSHFVPCGITDGGITSLQREKGLEIPPFHAWATVAGAVLCALGLDGLSEDG